MSHVGAGLVGDRVPLTIEQALGMLVVVDGRVDTFILVGPGRAVADMAIEQARQLFEENGVELAGPEATGMGFGVTSRHPEFGWVFYATKPGAVALVAS